MRIGRSLLIGSLVLAVMGVAQAALASPVLRVSRGAAVLLVTDNGVGDDNAASGVIEFNGSWAGWGLMVNGISAPLTGGAAMMLTGGVTNTIISSDRLIVELSDDSFSGGPGLFNLSYAGSMINFDPNSLSTSSFAYKSFDNQQFGAVNLGLSTSLVTGVGGLQYLTPFGDTSVATHGPIPSYAMTIGADFGSSELDTWTTFSLDASNVTVPEPVSLTLLGVGLLGITTLARRKSK